MFPKADIRLILDRRAARDCDLNRWMQHLNSNYRAEGVVNEAETEKIYH